MDLGGEGRKEGGLAGLRTLSVGTVRMQIRSGNWEDRDIDSGKVSARGGGETGGGFTALSPH